ncbi:hypothetical protein [uncultured Chitinophaga sp.]|uniref:hypothetical protein n=1 Tax=uncultured Chitinophaga sp. TaxID=339340 RepID=UPI0025CFCDB4|nr:hypothetical protein [uncultured Chitinophaga sp.]
MASFLAMTIGVSVVPVTHLRAALFTEAKTAHEDGFVPRHDDWGKRCSGNTPAHSAFY